MWTPVSLWSNRTTVFLAQRWRVDRSHWVSANRNVYWFLYANGVVKQRETWNYCFTGGTLKRFCSVWNDRGFCFAGITWPSLKTKIVQIHIISEKRKWRVWHECNWATNASNLWLLENSNTAVVINYSSKSNAFQWYFDALHNYANERVMHISVG